MAQSIDRSPGGVSAAFYCSFRTETQQWAYVGGTKGYLHVPGGRIWYARMGDGPGTPLIVIHGGPDDLATQPSGNSGPRIGCGVIVAAD